MANTDKKPPPGGLKSYTCIRAVMHDGLLYGAGEEIGLPKLAAGPLIQCGAITDDKSGKPRPDSDVLG